MTPDVTIEVLSELKRIPKDTLQSFGLVDDARGVLFTYRLPNGNSGRTRLRSALRGADGSSWLDDEDRPVTIYAAPSDLVFSTPGEVVIVEGESDCWAGWYSGLNVLGVPGAEHVEVLTGDHLQGVGSVLIQREKVSGVTKTFPQGVDHFVSTVVDRLRAIGYQHAVAVVEMPDDHSDLADLHVFAPDDFLRNFSRARRTDVSDE